MVRPETSYFLICRIISERTVETIIAKSKLFVMRKNIESFKVIRKFFNQKNINI